MSESRSAVEGPWGAGFDWLSLISCDTPEIYTPDALVPLQTNWRLRRLLSLVQIRWMEPSRGGGVSYAFLQGSVAKRQQFEGVLGVLVGEEACDGLPPLSEGDTKLLWDAINFLVRVNPLFLGLKCALETCGYSFLDVNPKHLSLSQGVVNSQQHRVGTSREGVFVSVDDYDSTSHDVRVEDIVIGTESRRTGGDLESTNVTYGDFELEAKTHPFLYPFGKGHYHYHMYKNDPVNTMKPSHYVQARLHAPISLWRDDRSWSFFQFDWMEKRRIHEAQAVMVKPNDATKSGNALTVDEIARANDVDSDLKRCFVPSSICGSKAYHRTGFLDLCSKVKRDGMPDLFLTLTANEMGWEDVKERCGTSPGSHPNESFEQIHHRFKLLWKHIKQGRIFGEISGSFVKLEYQERGCVHYHILLWLSDKKDKCKHVSAVIPPVDYRVPGKSVKQREDRQKIYDTLRSRVLDYQLHEHNEHCIEDCGSHVVRRQLETARSLLSKAVDDLEKLQKASPRDEEALHQCQTFLESQNLRVVSLTKKFLAAKAKENEDEELCEGDKDVDLDRDLPPGFRCTQNHPAPQSDCCFLDGETDRWTYTRRRDPSAVVDDTMVIEYNPKVTILWNGRHNIRLCSETFMCEYLLKYACKIEPVFSMEVARALPEAVKQYLSTDEGKHIYGRIVSAQQVAAHLDGVAHISMDESVTFLATDLPANRPKTLDIKEAKRRAALIAASHPPEVISADADIDGGGTRSIFPKILNRVMNVAKESYRQGFERLFAPRETSPTSRELTELGFDLNDVKSLFLDDQIDKYMDRPDECEDLGLLAYYEQFEFLGKTREVPAGRMVLYDRKGRRVCRNKDGKVGLVRYHCKIPHIDKEAYWYQQLLLDPRRPFRHLHELVSSSNSAIGTDSQFMEECCIRGLAKRGLSEVDIVKDILSTTTDHNTHKKLTKIVKKLEAEARSETVPRLCLRGWWCWQD